jgi:hypothetical protein
MRFEKEENPQKVPFNRLPEGKPAAPSPQPAHSELFTRFLIFIV